MSEPMDSTLSTEGQINQELFLLASRGLEINEPLSAQSLKLLKVVSRSYEAQKALSVDLNAQIANLKETIGKMADAGSSKKAGDDSLADRLVLRIQDLEQIINIISHNLRAPLANISSLCSLVLKMPDKGVKDFTVALNALGTSVKKLNEVIVGFDAIVESEEGAGRMMEEIVLSELVDDIKHAIGHLITKDKVTIRTDFGVPSLNSVRSYLYSIFYNLISNSIKYKRENESPVIEISSRTAGDKALILFKDNGLGFDLENKVAEIFGLRKRFNGHEEGSGLGLYMVRSHVQALGGQIELISTLNEGSEFRIQVPLRQG